MRFRVGKYDAHEGQQRQMHQMVVRITDVSDDVISEMFGEHRRVVMVPHGDGALIRKANPYEVSTRLTFSQGHWGASFQQPHYQWIVDLSPGWAMIDCQASVDQEAGGIKFDFPPLQYRHVPRKVQRRGSLLRKNESRAPEPLPAAVPELVPPLPVVGDIMIVMGDDSLIQKGIPLAKLKSFMSLIGGDWE